MSKNTMRSRCPMGIPAGVASVLIGLAGIILGIINKELTTILFGVALFLTGGPLAGLTMMFHGAIDRIEELEKAAKK